MKPVRSARDANRELSPEDSTMLRRYDEVPLAITGEGRLRTKKRERER